MAKRNWSGDIDSGGVKLANKRKSPINQLSLHRAVRMGNRRTRDLKQAICLRFWRNINKECLAGCPSLTQPIGSLHSVTTVA